MKCQYKNIEIQLPCNYDPHYKVTIRDYGDKEHVEVSALWSCCGGTAEASVLMPRGFEYNPRLMEQCREKLIKEIPFAEERIYDLAWDAYLDNMDC